jgi:hypothetical protein
MRNLQARVKAHNKAVAYGKELYPKLAEIFHPLIGQKILKEDGKLLKKIASQLPKLPNSPDLSVHPNSIHYALIWTVKTTEWTESGSEHEAIALYIGVIQDGVLESVPVGPYAEKDDWTVEEVQQRRQVYQAAKRAAADALNDLGPFGEYDF